MNRPMSKPTPALLRNVRLFSDLDERDLESLADEFNERRFAAGDKVALEGEGGLMFFVVESGELSVEVHGEPVSTIGPGAAFGEIALIDRRPRTATVTAVSDVTAYGLPVFVFRPFVEARPQVAWKMLEAMADRLAHRRSSLALVLRSEVPCCSGARRRSRQDRRERANRRMRSRSEDPHGRRLAAARSARRLPRRSTRPPTALRAPPDRPLPARGLPRG